MISDKFQGHCYSYGSRNYQAFVALIVQSYRCLCKHRPDLVIEALITRVTNGTLIHRQGFHCGLSPEKFYEYWMQHVAHVAGQPVRSDPPLDIVSSYSISI